MEKIIRIFLLLIISLSVAPRIFAGKFDVFKVVDTIPINNINKKKLFKFAEEWFEKEKAKSSALKVVRSNPDQFVIEGKGYVQYYNHIHMEEIFLSPKATERTNGTVIYNVKVTILDSIVIAEYTDFVHDAYFSEFGKISFGTLFDYENVPPGKCLENKIWCNKVWKDMKIKAEANVHDHSSRLVPESYQRKNGKVFKVEKQEVKKEAKKEAPDDYLKLDNYLNADEKADTSKAMIIK